MMYGSGDIINDLLIFTFKTFGQIIYYVLGVSVIYGGGTNLQAHPPPRVPTPLQCLIRLRCCPPYEAPPHTSVGRKPDLRFTGFFCPTEPAKQAIRFLCG